MQDLRSHLSGNCFAAQSYFSGFFGVDRTVSRIMLIMPQNTPATLITRAEKMGEIPYFSFMSSSNPMALVPKKMSVPCSKPIGPIGEFMNGMG